MEKTLLTANDGDVGKRLDIFIAEKLDITRSAAMRLIEPTPYKKNFKIPSSGFALEVEIPLPEPIDVAPENIPLDIVYEDEDIIVVNKEKGMVVHPAPGNERGTLVGALLYHCEDSLSGIGGALRPGIVHRIDKDTSGLLVCAKTDRAHTTLAEMIKEHRVKREYIALCLGKMKDESGTVDNYIGRSRVDRKKIAVLAPDDSGARRAITHYSLIENFKDVSYNRFTLETGRTHQIRVHMKYISHPIIGDELYGGDGGRFYKEHKKIIKGQCLHAEKLTFNHPISGREIVCHADAPEYFRELLRILRNEN